MIGTPEKSLVPKHPLMRVLTDRSIDRVSKSAARTRVKRSCLLIVPVANPFRGKETPVLGRGVISSSFPTVSIRTRHTAALRACFLRSRGDGPRDGLNGTCCRIRKVLRRGKKLGRHRAHPTSRAPPARMPVL